MRARAVGVAIAAVIVTASGLPIPAAAAGTATEFVPLSGARIYDTRNNTGNAGTTAVPANTTRIVQFAGVAGIPSSGVVAVLADLTSVKPAANTWFTLFPSYTTRPGVTSLTSNANEINSNLVAVELGNDGAAALWNAASASHVIIDVHGYFTSSTSSVDSGFQPTMQTRILDTRPTSNIGGHAYKVAAGETLTLNAAAADVPNDAAAVLLNAAVVNASASGYLTAYAAGSTRPATSNVDFPGGEVTSGSLTVRLRSADGAFSIYNGSTGSIDLILDVQGYFAAGGTEGAASGIFYPVNVRVLDTRATGVLDPGAAVNAQITGGATGAPTDGSAGGVLLNIHAVSPSGSGHVEAYPAGDDASGTSALNFTASESNSNLAALALPESGRVTLKNVSSGSLHVIADVQGWFSGGALPDNLEPNLDALRHVTDTVQGVSIMHDGTPVTDLTPEQRAVAESLVSTSADVRTLLTSDGISRTHTVSDVVPWLTGGGAVTVGAAVEVRASTALNSTVNTWLVQSDSSRTIIPHPYYQRTLVQVALENTWTFTALVDLLNNRVAGFRLSDVNGTMRYIATITPYPYSLQSAGD